MTAPLLASPRIPSDASEPLFFFGTLLDAEILGLVIGREIEAEELVAAVLPEFRRVRVDGRSYPMLVAAPGLRVEGALWQGASAAAIHRLNLYEGPEYGAELRMVLDLRGKPLPAWVYVAASARLVPSPDLWSLADWQARYKTDFMARGRDLVGSELP